MSSKPASQQASKPASQQASKPASQQASKPARGGGDALIVHQVGDNMRFGTGTLVAAGSVLAWHAWVEEVVRFHVRCSVVKRRK
ncbi:hypothetical protein Vi05172_g10007 [Venturia inaequalis]|nr:hypothetical protein Vi05172_g10007 [Venturia inaequalis]